VKEEGSIALPSRKFSSLVFELIAPEVEIRAPSQTAMIHSGSSKFKIQGLSPQEFPQITDLSETLLEPQQKLSFSASLLKGLLESTFFAAGRNETKPILHSLHLQIFQGKLFATGTDGKRLAKASLPLSEPSQDVYYQDRSFILPIKTVSEMIGLLESAKLEESSLFLTEEKLSLQTGPFTFSSLLLPGEYPDVSRIIPSKSEAPIFLHREELSSLLRQVALFTTETNTSVRFLFTPGTLHLSIASSQTGEGDVEMPVNYQGDALEIAFNPNYFLDILRHVKDETFAFDITDSYNPGLISDSSTAFFVLMPMRLG
jgi:DNA polymerase-3 subunit beta